MFRPALLLPLLVTALACSSGNVAPPLDPSQDAGAVDPADAGELADAGLVPDAGINPLIEARPYALHVPTDYDAKTPTPLLLLLHGYGANGNGQATYFKLLEHADRETFLLAYPDGTLDRTARRFWNATDSCCDMYGVGVDDVAYLTGLIVDVQRQYNVDRQRIFVVGHSNGGFMAHRLACEIPERIAGIVSLAGSTYKDPGRCAGSGPVAVLQVHGDADTVVAYGGGTPSNSPTLPPFPSAKETVARWAAKNGCSATSTLESQRLDVDNAVLGSETRIDRHLGCSGGAAELWTLENGGHIPLLNAAWPEAIYDFLMAHPKPSQSSNQEN